VIYFLFVHSNHSKFSQERNCLSKFSDGSFLL